jgi:hypothetical protein
MSEREARADAIAGLIMYQDLRVDAVVYVGISAAGCTRTVYQREAYSRKPCCENILVLVVCAYLIQAISNEHSLNKKDPPGKAGRNQN